MSEVREPSIVSRRSSVPPAAVSNKDQDSFVSLGKRSENGWEKMSKYELLTQLRQRKKDY